MKPTRKLNADQRFFFDHAGWSYGPDESAARGRTRCAVALAAAEAYGREQGWEVTWEPEDDPDLSWMDDEERAQEHEVLCAVLKDASGKVLASLGNIVDASSEYARVVEAELMEQARDEQASAQPEPTTEQVYEALEQAIDEVCDVDTRNEISAAYRKIMRDAGFTEGNEETAS